MENETDRLRAWFDGLADDAVPTEECPAPDVLWMGASGELPADRFDRLVEHLATCASCDEDWKIAIEIGASATQRRRFDVPIWIAFAAAAVLIVAVVVGTRPNARHPQSGPSTTYRSPSTDRIASLIPDGAVVPADQVRLRWSSLGGGTRYAVEIATEDLTIVDRAEGLTVNEYLVPANKTRVLAPGTRLVWQVRATMPGGRQIRSISFLIVLR